LQTSLIIFDKKVKVFIFLIITGFILSVIFKLHGLSVNEWDNNLPSQQYTSSNVLIGKSQGIRSDEWLVSTPFIFSQIKHNFSKNNLNIGESNVSLIVHYNLPIYHFTSLFKPQNYAFFFLDDERGFSFAWNYKVFGLLLSTFFLLMIFTESNFLLSVTGSFLVYLSSFNQWWFSIPLPDLLIAFNMIIVFFAYFINAVHKTQIILYPLGIIYFFINFVLILYPPFQITLGYLALLLMGILLFEYYKNNKYNYISLKLIMTIASLSILSLIFYYFYLDIKDAVKIILNTEYPGDRKLLGGEMNIAQYFSGYYDFFYSSSRFPESYGNVCESSNFFFIFPFFIPILLTSIFKKSLNIDYKIWLLMLYIAIVSIWAFWGFSEAIAHMTLFEKVQPKRSLLGIGIANIIVTIIFLNWLQKKDLFFRYSLEYYISIFFTLFFLGKLMQISDSFYTDTRIVISSFIFSFIVYAIFTRKVTLFVLTLILISIPSFFINPLAHGIPQFKKKELAEFIESNHFEKKQWLAYDNPIIPMYLKALGLEVINGVNFIPNFERLKILDPNENNKKIYNRYAHIAVKPLFNEGSTISFQLKAADAYEIYINPCSEEVKSLDIKYFIFPDSYRNNINDIKGCKLHLLNDKPLNNYNIYERLDR
jgi:hypothetical protein